MGEPSTAAPTTGTLRQSALVCLLLAAATVFAFWPVVHLDFVDIDDPLFVTHNQHVLHGLTWDGIKWAFQFGHGDYWHPVVWLSLMADVSVFGTGPLGLHVVNVVLHAGNAILLFLFLRRWTGTLWRSAIVAALFALHPLRVESVAWVTERKDVLSALFFMLTLLAYGRYARGRSRVEGRESGANPSPPALDPRSSTLDYLLALLFFALGLMSKSVVVTLPCILLMLDWWPLKRVPSATGPASAKATAGSQGSGAISKLLAEKIPFFALSAVSGLIHLGTKNNDKPQFTMGDLPPLERVETFFVTYTKYLGKTLWPTRLAAYYQHPWRWEPWLIVLSLVIIVGFSVLALSLVRRRPYLFVGWFWFLGVLVPMMGLTSDWHQYMADRFTYLPSIGLFIAMVWGLAELSTQRAMRLALAAAMVAVLFTLSFRTRNEVRNWQNTEVLFRHALAVGEKTYLAYDRLGEYLARHGQLKEAMEAMQPAMEIRGRMSAGVPDGPSKARLERVLDNSDASMRANFGFVLAQQGKIEEAVVQWTESARLSPEFVVALNNLGQAYLQLGKFDEAIPPLKTSVRVDPNVVEIRSLLGMALEHQGLLDDAIAQYVEILRLEPQNSEAHYVLARLLSKAGRPAEALPHVTEALRGKPDFPEAAELQRKLRN